MPDVDTTALRDEVLAGLRATPRQLPAKLLYDAEGASLFTSITQLEEYYVTRTELAIYDAHGEDIAARLAGRVVVEPGAGEGEKLRALLARLPRHQFPAAYVPIDVAEEQLHRVAGEIAAEYGIHVAPVVADYLTLDELPSLPGELTALPRTGFFPGSTIGNLEPEDAVAFLSRLAHLLGPDASVILGVDLRKDPLVLHAAYNDRLEVTATFNLNLLARLNRELDATFDVESFRHYAYYNPAVGRVEMHLVSLVEQTVSVAGEPIHFEQGEGIWTESSYKYTLPQLDALAADGGFRVSARWMDEHRWFVVAVLEAISGRR